VRDRSHAADVLAPLLYVSPGQINYALPSSDPFAWIGIERVGEAYVPHGIALPVTPVAPGLFSVGAGLAAASALKITATAQVEVPVTRCVGPICSSIPIDVSGAPVYLSLYGTGFSQVLIAPGPGIAGSNCTIGAQLLPVTYAGAQGQIPGLDQINILLPASLAGTGVTSVSCRLLTAGGSGAVTNPVGLAIR
jgi:uncharacterized protein (TIGR03437 family)